MKRRGRPSRGSRGDGAAPPEGSWIVGRNAVGELLDRAAGVVEKVLLDAALPEPVRRRFEAQARRAGVVVQSAPRQALERIAEGAVHQGVAARRARLQLLSLDELLSRLGPVPLLVACDHVEDPHVLGAIVRSAAAAGAAAVILPRRRSARLGPAAAKAAAGALERVPLAQCGSVAEAVRRLQAEGIGVVGLDARGDAAWSPGPDLTGPACLVVGAEDRGLTRLVRERCDSLLGFPLARGVESLNASVAAALGLFEAVRQRREAGIA